MNELKSTEPELYVSHRQLVGAMAMWAIAENPIYPPRNLDGALKKFYDTTLPFFSADPAFVVCHTPTRIFGNRMELRAYIQPILESIPEVMDWNKTQNEINGIAKSSGIERQVQFIWGGSGEHLPEDDFVDIGAMSTNIANYFHFEEVHNQAFDQKFNEDHPQPPALTSTPPIKMRDDGQLPTQAVKESFDQWIERTAVCVLETNDLLVPPQHMDVYRSRIDGGYLGHSRSDFKWLYDDGITEAIQMLDAEERKTCLIGFNPGQQKWYGWGRATCGFGIGYVAEKGDSVTTSGWDAEELAKHPEKDYRVHVGFEAKTLLDCKRLAIAYAESVS